MYSGNGTKKKIILVNEFTVNILYIYTGQAVIFTYFNEWVSNVFYADIEQTVIFFAWLSLRCTIDTGQTGIYISLMGFIAHSM
jgi:hypothetical protein